MYRIAILSNLIDTGQTLREQTERFCAENGIFPRVEFYHEQEQFFGNIREFQPTSAIIALPGVEGLNAAEHLRSLLPDCGLIWCSDLDFSLHAFRIRAEYFILAPPGEQDIRDGLSVWMEQRKYKQKVLRG